ncbi:calcium/sodium antiporter [Pseudomonadota bacterium]
MNVTVLILAALGVVMLVGGAEMLVRGASRFSARFGISPLVIGLTVVAFGTSSPELAVSIKAGFAAQSDIALGNVVGSNILNVLLILGLSALITPLVVSRQLVRLEIPLLIGSSLVLLLMTVDEHVSHFDGVLLVIGILAYTLFAIRHSHKENMAVKAEYAGAFNESERTGNGKLFLEFLFVIVGLALLMFGAHWIVESAVVVARWLGVSELIIGLTIVAVGTSLPEVATSIVAALRGERDIAVGNVIGSCLFNILAVTGIAAMVTPNGLEASPALVRFDIPVMVAVTLACLPIFATGHLIARWEGGLFLGYYLAYVLYLVLTATGHDSLPVFSTAMLGFALPITAVTLIVLWMRQRAPVGKSV